MVTVWKVESIAADFPQDFIDSDQRAFLEKNRLSLVDHVLENKSIYRKASNKRKWVAVWNSVSFYYVENDENKKEKFSGDVLESNDLGWNPKNPLELTRVSDMELRNKLGSNYLECGKVDWSCVDDFIYEDSIDTMFVNEKDLVSSVEVSKEKIGSFSKMVKDIEKKDDHSIEESNLKETIEVNRNNVSSSVQKNIQKKRVTSKEDLYLEAIVPVNDWSRGYKLTGAFDIENYIPISLPEIPTKQCEVTVTTDSSKMLDREFLNLFPTQFIRTRRPVLYEMIPGCEYDEKLGVILNIEGFTKEQILDNIVKYPVIHELKRQVDENTFDIFYTKLEIDGQLYDIETIWSELKDTKDLPHNKALMSDYVTRRYLLERDVKGVKHKYPLFGRLEPFMTLFMTPKEYKQYGYDDPLYLAKTCVQSRQHFLVDRNPVLRHTSTIDRCVFSRSCFKCENCSYACAKRMKMYSVLYVNNLSDLKEHNRELCDFKIDVDTVVDFYKKYQDRQISVYVPSGVSTMDLGKVAMAFFYVACCLYNDSSYAKVYHLKYGSFLEEERLTWNNNCDSDTVDHVNAVMKLAEKTKILIISDLARVNFTENSSQKLIRLIQTRYYSLNFKTIVISPPFNYLHGKSSDGFFSDIQRTFREYQVEGGKN